MRNTSKNCMLHVLPTLIPCERDVTLCCDGCSDPSYGIRNLNDVKREAASQGLHYLAHHAMPANNFVVVYVRHSTNGTASSASTSAASTTSSLGVTLSTAIAAAEKSAAEAVATAAAAAAAAAAATASVPTAAAAAPAATQK
jgi:hypothetical protein